MLTFCKNLPYQPILIKKTKKKPKSELILNTELSDTKCSLSLPPCLIGAICLTTDNGATSLLHVRTTQIAYRLKLLSLPLQSLTPNQIHCTSYRNHG